MLFQLSDEDFGYRGDIVLRGVSLAVHEGERVALIGESGAGKSTLISILQHRYAAVTAFVPQDLGLVGNLSVFHNIYMGTLSRHSIAHNLLNLVWPRPADIARVRPIAEQLGLGDKLFSKAGELSGGQQQRTAICRALLQGGTSLLGDEPVSANDQHQSRVIMDAITSSFGTVVLAMHDVDLALEYSTRIVGIKDQCIAIDVAADQVSRADLDFLYLT
ncbi:MAG: ATP-binding cassette domain-containing protein [Proteobacteria bacterium]|nr:ATP-binding cassette domain-containing protein [Pseudomonadota bacterium]